MALTDQNGVVITAPVPVVAGYTLNYGALSLGGNVSDSDGTYYTTTGTGGVVVPLDNWVRVFSHVF